MIANTIKEGKIVPSEVTVRLLQNAMQDSGNDKFLIDGFPRNDENRAAFESVVSNLNLGSLSVLASYNSIKICKQNSKSNFLDFLIIMITLNHTVLLRLGSSLSLFFSLNALKRRWNDVFSIEIRFF